MNPDLRAVMKEGDVKDGKNFTHTTMFPYHEWNIKSSFLTEFFKRYCDLVQSGQEDLCLHERPTSRAPFILFMNFKFINDGKLDVENPFSNNFILHLTASAQYIIYDQMTISPEVRAQTLRACVCEAPAQIDGDIINCKMRLQFPYCKTDVAVQKKKLIPELIKKLRSDNIIGYLDQQPTNDWNEIIDIPAIDKPIPMLGSTSQHKLKPFYLKYILDIITDQHLEQEHIPDMDVGEAFDIKEHEDVSKNIINKAEFDDMDINALVPLFLSLNYGTYVTLCKDKFIVPIKINIISDNNKDLEKAQIYLDLIAPHRKNNEVYWLEIGASLYKTAKGSSKGLEIWRLWTQDSTIKKPDDCNYMYYTFRKTKLTLKTIAWYARLDDPPQYKAINQKEYEKLMKKASDCTHEDVAECMYGFFWLEVAFDECWHIYDPDSHRWYADTQSCKIPKLIKERFVPEFEELRSNYSNAVKEERDDGKKEQLEISIKKLTNLIGKLKNQTFKSQCIKTAQSYFEIDGFYLNLNENAHYIGMINCVIDTTLNAEPLVRPGKPEDFISMTTNVFFPHHFDEVIGAQDKDEKRPYDNVSDDLDKLSLRGWHDALTRKLIIWLGQVFVDPELRHYFWKDASSFLRGRNAEKLLRVWSGRKDTSKSMIAKLFDALGMYKINMSVSFLSGKTGNSSSPSPDIARVKGTRLAVMAEPDEFDDKLSSGKIKRATGNDSVYARFLHSNGGDIECMQKMVLCCNNIPEIIGLASDDASIDRLLILPFLSLWVKNPPETPEEQYKLRRFPMDRFFEHQIPLMASSFIWVLVKYFNTYLKEGLEAPEIVKKFTGEYVKSLDPYHRFKEENLEYAYKDAEKTMIDTNVKLLHKDLYGAYKTWFVDSNPGSKKIPDSDLVKREFEKRLGKQINKTYVGIRFIQVIPTL
jgi:hypothetical protein